MSERYNVKRRIATIEVSIACEGTSAKAETASEAAAIAGVIYKGLG